MMFIKKPVNLIIFISTLLIFGTMTLISSTKQVEANKTIATLINNYYETVENEDLSAVSDLLYAESEAKKKEIIAYHKFVFDAVDTKINSIVIENMELNEDDGIGIVFITVNSDIYDIDASDSFNKLSDYAVLIKKSNHKWLIAKIMRAEDFNTVLKLTLFNKYAHEVDVSEEASLKASFSPAQGLVTYWKFGQDIFRLSTGELIIGQLLSFNGSVFKIKTEKGIIEKKKGDIAGVFFGTELSQLPFLDNFSSGLVNWDTSGIKPDLVEGKLYWDTGQFATLILKITIPIEDVIIEFDGYVEKNGFNVYCWDAANKGYTVFIGGWYNTKSGSDVGAGGEKRVLVNGAVWKTKE